MHTALGSGTAFSSFVTQIRLSGSYWEGNPGCARARLPRWVQDRCTWSCLVLPAAKEQRQGRPRRWPLAICSDSYSGTATALSGRPPPRIGSSSQRGAAAKILKGHSIALAILSVDRLEEAALVKGAGGFLPCLGAPMRLQAHVYAGQQRVAIQAALAPGWRAGCRAHAITRSDGIWSLGDDAHQELCGC